MKINAGLSKTKKKLFAIPMLFKSCLKDTIGDYHGIFLHPCLHFGVQKFSEYKGSFQSLEHSVTLQ